MRKSYALRWIWVIAAALLAAVIIFLPFRGALRAAAAGGVAWLIQPVSMVARIPAGIMERIGAFKSGADFMKEKEALMIDRAELELLKKENEALRTALAMGRAAQRNASYGSVIGGFSEGRDEYLIVRLAEGTTLHEGAVAFSPAGVLIGFVRAAAETTATIRLISSPDETITVTIVGPGIDAVMKGDNNGEYVVSLVPETAAVELGALVVASGRNPGIPGGTPVGTVVSVERIPGELYYDVRVKSPVPFAALSDVILLFD